MNRHERELIAAADRKADAIGTKLAEHVATVGTVLEHQAAEIGQVRDLAAAIGADVVERVESMLARLDSLEQRVAATERPAHVVRSPAAPANPKAKPPGKVKAT